MAEVFRPDEEALRHAGFGAVCHVPVLFGKTRNSPAQKHYLREFNRYLRERALLEWVPVDRTTAAQIKRLGDTKKLRYPTRCSLGSYAERLANFDDWLAETNRGWRTVEYTRDIVLGYQADMLSGRWSETGRKLTPATVKVRVAEACLFLSWAAARGYRHVFDVVHTAVNNGVQNGVAYSGERGIVVHSRAGTPADASKPAIEIPSPEEVEAWLSTVNLRRGHTKWLMCRFALRAAARKSEVTLFQLGDFTLHDPARGDPKDGTRPWRVIGDKVELVLRHGTKGRRASPVDQPNIGPERRIAIPIDLARDLLAYRDGRRLRAAMRFAKREGHRPDRPGDRFWLSEHDGRPVSADAFYRVWSEVKPTPMQRWHPHFARHYWACTTLLDHLETEASKIRDVALERMPEAWLTEMGRSFLQTIIRPQLGHVSEETTLLYTTWISRHIYLAKYYAGYHAHLAADDV